MGGFARRTILRGAAPLVVVVLLLAGGGLGALAKRLLNRSGSSVGSTLARGVLGAVPVTLFWTFCLCPGVSAGIFRAWTCTPFVVDDTFTDARQATSTTYLLADLRVVCSQEGSMQPEHERIKRIALGFVVVWPVLLPTCYLLLLLGCRASIAKRQNTPFSRSIQFLFYEYEPYALHAGPNRWRLPALHPCANPIVTRTPFAFLHGHGASAGTHSSGSHSC